MPHDIRRMIEKHRGSDSMIWKILVRAKDAAWRVHDRYRAFVSKAREARENRKISENWGSAYSRPGLGLWGYLSFRRTLDDRGKLKIPDGITEIKLDIGMSHSAPNSLLWLRQLDDRIVFGFEPNPENVRKLNISEKLAPYLNKRFFVFPLAIDDGEPAIKRFHMAQEDAGTSSLYAPTRLKVKKTIDVPTISLADFLSLIPWDRIPRVEHVKIDTQGNDLRVIQSAGTYLYERIVFVTAECTTNGHYAYSHTEAELDAYMRANGFKVVEGSSKGDDKTYVNSRFSDKAVSLDRSTQ